MVFFLTLLLGIATAQDKPIRVAVIDTGLDLKDTRFSHLLCKDATHKDFTGEGILDHDGHGTHVAGIIKQNAGNANYCLIILKYWTNYMRYDRAGEFSTKAMKEAVNQHADIVNFSSEGNDRIEEEYQLIKNAKDTAFVVAAGNSGINIDLPMNHVYPASYGLKNVIPVGNLMSNWIRQSHSNYGDTVLDWEIGTDVMSTVPDFMCGNYLMPKYECQSRMTGTSMAAPVKTGKLILEKLRNNQ